MDLYLPVGQKLNSKLIILLLTKCVNVLVSTFPLAPRGYKMSQYRFNSKHEVSSVEFWTQLYVSITF